MAYDFKKEEKHLYKPGIKPSIIEVPTMSYIAVRGKGDPNEEDGAYKKAIEVLYSVAYAIRMSYKKGYDIEGFFEYVVPPLEGFWWQDGVVGVDYADKSTFQWISMIRLPHFVREKHLDWAKTEVYRKKKLDTSKAEFLTIDEGLCAQVMHIGPFDTESVTIDKMNMFIKENGYETDINMKRRHHEIYLSDIRKVEQSKWKTVIRHPVRVRRGYESLC